MDRKKIILGCGNFGGVGSIPTLVGQGDSASSARVLLDQALRLGITQFDTANTYGGGQSETILGEWLRAQSPSFRKAANVATKVGNPHGCSRDERPLSRVQIRSHLESSLRRLGVERISVYYLHEPDPQTPLDESLEAIQEALQKGLIASFGLSNVDKDHVEKVLNCAGLDLGRKLSSVQNEFHFLRNGDSQDLIPFLTRRGIRYVAYSPLAGGLLTGKYKDFKNPPKESRLSIRSEPYQHFLDSSGCEKIAGFIAESKTEKPALRALRFVLETPGIHAAVIGPRKLEHYETLGLELEST